MHLGGGLHDWQLYLHRLSKDMLVEYAITGLQVPVGIRALLCFLPSLDVFLSVQYSCASVMS